MNIEFINKDGEKHRYTGVAYFQQDLGEIAFFNNDDLGFIHQQALVTYAGPGHTSNVPAANEESMENVMADLRKKEEMVDGMLIVGSFAYSGERSSEEKSEDADTEQREQD
jgi:hypothetical protein